MQSQESVYRSKAAEAAAQIAILDLPTDSWPGIIPLLSKGVTEQSSDPFKEACLVALSEICIGSYPGTLAPHSFNILFAIITGMDSPHTQLQLVATKALANAIEFSESNFENDEQRNSIMALVIKMASSPADDVRLEAFVCMVNIAVSYYNYLDAHMNQGLYTATIEAIRSDASELVVMQAIEFWSSICEEETSIFRENTSAAETGAPALDCHEFIQGAIRDLAPLLFTSLSRGELDPELEEATVVSSASACISLIAGTLGNDVVPHFLDLISGNINSEESSLRTASILAFGSIMDGPSTETLALTIFEALPVIFERASPSEEGAVRHTAIWCLECVAEFHPAAIDSRLPDFLGTCCSVFGDESPAIAASAANAIQALAQHITYDKRDESPLNPHLTELFKALTDLSDREDADEASLRISAYAAIRSLVTATPDSQINHIQSVIDLFAPRLQQTIGGTIDSTLQGELVGITSACMRRLGTEQVSETLADTLMQVYLDLLSSRAGVANIYIEVFMAAGALCHAVGPAFTRYMADLAPYLLIGLEQWQEDELCSQALALCSAICYSLTAELGPYVEKLVSLFGEHLRNPDLSPVLGPLIVNTFADIAHALQGGFMTYLPTVMDILQRFQADACKNTDEMSVWSDIAQTNSWRMALLSNFSIILQSCGEDHINALRPYLNSMTRLLTYISNDRRREDDVNRLTCGLIIDVATYFPDHKSALMTYGPFLEYCRNSSLSEDRTRDFAEAAIDVLNQ